MGGHHVIELPPGPAYAIIPARGGSKRVPRKNIRDFHGKPLIHWPISTLLQSGMFEKVIVSTESPEISRIAQDAGAEVPFVRPNRLADDYSSTAAVAWHAVSHLVEYGASKDSLFCVVYPAAVMIEASDFEASRKLVGACGDLIFCASEFPAPIERAWFVNAKGAAEPLSPHSQQLRTQKLRAAHYDSGQFYWANAATWEALKEGNQVNRGAYVVPSWRAIDIDTEADWLLAEKLFLLGLPAAPEQKL